MKYNLDKYIEKRKKKKFYLKQEIFFMILFLLFSGCFQNNLFSQTLIDYSQSLHFRNEIKIDSIFEYFEYPQLPEEIKFPNYYWQNIAIAAFVFVDTNNKVNRIRIYRLYEFEDDTLVANKIWSILGKSIQEASKKWIFRM
ncbi:MAG: hypothetical protein V1779_09750 [bacterium]